MPSGEHTAIVAEPSQRTMKSALKAFADRSNAGDAEGLVALFAPNAVIEDPVGSPANQAAILSPRDPGKAFIGLLTRVYDPGQPTQYPPEPEEALAA